MGRKRDSLIWDHFEQINGISKCKHCEAEFKGNPSAKRLRNHLLGGEGGGIRSCPKVPDHVKIALRDDSTSRKRPRSESPEKGVQAGHQSVLKTSSHMMQLSRDHIAGARESPRASMAGLQAMWKDHQQNVDDVAKVIPSPAADQLLSEQPAGDPIPMDEEVPGVMHRTEPSSSNNDLTDSNSTNAPQDNYKTKNLVQDGERMQPVVEGTETESKINARPLVQVPDHVNKALSDGLRNTSLCDTEASYSLFPEAKLVGDSFEKNAKTVQEWLSSDKVSTIGLYGMGGVGKTALVKHIYNIMLKQRSMFGQPYWVTVSQDSSIERLQTQLAKTVGVDFGDEDDLNKRAARLRKELSRGCKFVLILDDLWNYFDLKYVGIPVEVNGCKLIVTTRSLEVCRWTNCQETLKVGPLLKNEAWKLFLETLGHALAPGFEQIARAIVRECDGLPLGIVTMARSMRHVDNIHVWENALMELQNSEIRQDDMEPEVFRILRYSYASLNDPTLQECLLYCALFPDDFLIKREELIEYLIVEGIIQKMNSRRAEFNRGHTILSKLTNVGLLECADGGSVKMHALIRDMAIQIMKQCSPSLVEAGKQLTNLPDQKRWTENIVRVSLAKNGIVEIPSHYSPRCPNLSTLLLSNNCSLKTIAEPFFCELHGLKVLNLSETRIEKLPNSVADLAKLTALILRGCKHLTTLPSLQKLRALEMVDLCRCERLEIVPKGLESLYNLNYLNLFFTQVKQFPAGILANLSCLQFLGFYKSSEGLKGEEVGCLHNLETLFGHFNDGKDLNSFMHSLSKKKQLSKYVLLVSPKNHKFDDGLFSNFNESGKDLCFSGCNLSGEVLLPKDVEELHINDVSIEDRGSLCLKNAIGLKRFDIQECKEIEYLFCLRSLPCIQSLEAVQVSRMWKLRGLFSSKDDDVVHPPTSRKLPTVAIFSRLVRCKIYRCDIIKKLFPSALLSNLMHLQQLEVKECWEMEEIIASEEEEGSIFHSFFTHTLFTLPNLTNLCLWRLPTLKSICNANLKCDSLQFVYIRECPGLKKIPISLPLSSLKEIKVQPKEWWESVEWGDSNQKFELQPKFLL